MPARVLAIAVAFLFVIAIMVGISYCTGGEEEVDPNEETTEVTDGEWTTEETTEVTDDGGEEEETVIEPTLPETGGDGIKYASFYGTELTGSLQANGEPFVPWHNTVASWEYELGDELLICDDFCTTAVVEDKGPAAWTGKDIDLSLGTAYWCGLVDEGVGFVYVEEL